jgi:hypothetical protein
MGCDIHCFVEKKVGDNWEQIGEFISDWYDEDSKYLGGDEFKSSYSPVDGRNYILFAALAGVRNGIGISPVSDPRGIPKDCCYSIKDDYEGWGYDAHTPSHLTIQELRDYNWTQAIRRGGFVSYDEFKEYIKTGSPSSWCGGVGGGNTEIISNDRMMMAVKGLIPLREDKWYYTEIEWNDHLNKYLDIFLDRTLPQLEERCEAEDFSDVRIVFWFDN